MTYYLEAMTAQPGLLIRRSSFVSFGLDMGAAILEVAQRYQEHENNGFKLVARMLAPREAVGAATGPDSFRSIPEEKFEEKDA